MPITYADKELYEDKPEIPIEKKWRFEDANEVKTVVNGIESDVASLPTHQDIQDAEDILQASIDLKQDQLVSFVDVATSRDLALTDRFKTLRASSGSTITVTIQLQSTIAWTAGDWFLLRRDGAGVVQFAPVVGVTINSSSGGYTVPDDHLSHTIFLVYEGSNVWTLQNGSAAIGTWQTWTPTITGVASQPTMSGRYVQIGKIVHCILRMATAPTSDATTKTITLPVAADSSSIQASLVPAVTNGAEALRIGIMYTRVGSNIADVYPDNVNAWSAVATIHFDLNFTYSAL